MSQTEFLITSNRFLSSMSAAWRLATILAVFIFFGLSVRWSCLDISPPAWDQGLYLYQATILHNTLMQNGFFDFFISIFNLDRGRVPLLPVIVQPAFYFFGPSLDAAVISLNFTWFILAWALFGIARELASPQVGDKAGFFVFVLFGLHPLTTMLSHNYLVELPFVAFVCAAIYSLWLLYRTRERKWSVISGIFIFLGLLTKVTFVAFVLPAFIFLVYSNIRKLSVWSTFVLFIPVIFFTILAGLYYFYNLRQIFEMTILLSSHGMAQLYGFGNAFDIHVVLEYLRNVFTLPAMLIASFFAVVMLILRFIQPRKNVEKVDVNIHTQTLIKVLFLWLIIPFILATFGEIKDPRYLYPSLVPVFVFAGIMVSRFPRSKLAVILVALAYMLPLSGYLYSNSLLSENLANQFRSVFKINPVLALDAEARPDSRNWNTDKIVSEIAKKLDAAQASKTVIFLGGNRYYHLRLLDYEGLKGGFYLTYMVLPYYSNTSMSVDDALKFIKNKSPSGIIYKSGDNWPPFSSRLDSGIVAQLKKDPKYKAVDLDVAQPDGSRFTLFINLSKMYVQIKSASDLVDNWKAGEGQANIAGSDTESLVLTTETGSQALAKLQNGIVYVPSWNISGKLTDDLQNIQWSNGFLWRRSTIVKASETAIKNP
ncbi:glycosyltransferase family 39 protein [Methylobacter sp. S3L5C]|uniref:ArnT family glycosyltransferase n=1 Tax=Methylobacter sp. S3L5C TaxID=2839024 RepID=UPI001FABEC7D|nr:glycosyltransferase family 39 protein [Methylobacter sp. S3L5C]UOA09528.1 glycosyltransferase family 39 protein [Methylobacter sp. S3L5C]